MEDILDLPEKGKVDKPNYRPIYLWGFLFVIGTFFKIQHWPFSGIMILVSTSGLTAYVFWKILLISKWKNQIFLAVLIIGLLWFLYIIWGMLFNGGHPFNERGLNFYLVSFVLLSIPYLIINLFKRKKLKREL